MFVIKIIEQVNGYISIHSNKYVEVYNPYKKDEDGYLILKTTDDINKAKQCTLSKIIKLYNLSNGIRKDGKPNKPLTGYTVKIVEVTLL